MYHIFWTALTIVMLTWYAITVVVVARKGATDLKTMFKSLSENLKEQ